MYCLHVYFIEEKKKKSGFFFTQFEFLQFF